VPLQVLDLLLLDLDDFVDRLALSLGRRTRWERSGQIRVSREQRGRQTDDVLAVSDGSERLHLLGDGLHGGLLEVSRSREGDGG
jgi:hypothetical protein